MIRTIIIDDEPKNISILKNLVSLHCPQVELVGEAGDVIKGTEVIAATNPDLVLLDIEMPYGNGFDILNNLQPIGFEVIFTTAFDKYILQALKYAAVDYLLKPINIEELKLAVQKAGQKINRATASSRIEVLLDNFKSAKFGLQKIALPTETGLIFIPIHEILRCEASGSYTQVHLKNGQKYIASRSIKDYEEILPSSIFFRVHNSHLINLNFIIQYHRGRGGYIEMEDGMEIEVAVRRKAEFLNRFNISG